MNHEASFGARGDGQMGTHELLVKARNEIADPERWSEDGWGDSEYGPRCLVNALTWAACDSVTEMDTDMTPVLDAATRVAFDAIPEQERYLHPLRECAMGMFNDSHSHGGVLAVLDRAIAATAPSPDLGFLDGAHVAPEVTA